MDTFKRYAVEVLAAVWLVLIAVQFLSRYFLPGNSVDFSGVYIAMLCLTGVIVIVRMMGMASARLRKGK